MHFRCSGLPQISKTPLLLQSDQCQMCDGAASLAQRPSYGASSTCGHGSEDGASTVTRWRSFQYSAFAWADLCGGEQQEAGCTSQMPGWRGGFGSLGLDTALSPSSDSAANLLKCCTPDCKQISSLLWHHYPKCHVLIDNNLKKLLSNAFLRGPTLYNPSLS